jgi:hypothetical protein
VHSNGEAGQINDDGIAGYLADTWNRMDFCIYIIFLIWLLLKYTQEANW